MFWWRNKSSERNCSSTGFDSEPNIICTKYGYIWRLTPNDTSEGGGGGLGRTGYGPDPNKSWWGKVWGVVWVV